ncbi:MAG TPA: DPP IV N-terminal domain-containing protein [Pyrinomonadaceae bacterium]|nr:DPP IV N-terminal domain-containing protein [Pyrinomonadaceae bacterium]
MPNIRVAFAILFLAVIPSARAQNKLLTIDDIFDPQKRINFSGNPDQPRWLKDGDHYLVVSKDRNASPRLLKVDAVSGKAEPFYDAARMQAAFAALPGMSKDDARDLANQTFYLLNPNETAVLINFANDLFYYEFGSDRAIRLTSNPEEEVGEAFSPDGRMVSFVRGGNLYVEDLGMQRRERALTRDGSDKILNGRLDWVFQEELYGRGNFGAYWWSPDSTKIVFLRLDETPVPEFPVVDHIPLDQAVESTPYPKAGDPNPIVKLGIANAAGGEILWVKTARYRPDDLLITRVGWFPDSKHVWFAAQDREQTFLDFNELQINGLWITLFHEQTKTWVETIDEGLRWLKDGSFLWLSDRSGWRHIYQVMPKIWTASPVMPVTKQITNGDWDVRSIDGVDEEKGIIYFSASEHSFIANHEYAINLDGSGMTRITTTEGSHRVSFNASGSRFVDFRSDVNTPIQVGLFQGGKFVRAIDENKVDALSQYKLGKPEFLNVKTRDGFTMEAMMIKPPDFDPRKKYPVMSYTYSGPQAPQVRNQWGGSTYMFHQMLAQKGYIIWICDNRTASNKGVNSTWPLFHNFGVLELRDLEDGFSWLKQQPYVDAERIGLWGWSYGGFMTSYALTHSQTFKIGIAGGTVADWRNYDSIYTERYMGTPQDNPDGYWKSSPVHYAKDMHGKLLLIHGAIDDNVHMSNTMQFLYELQKAGKPVQFMVYPKSRHGVTDPVLLKHLRQMMLDFIVENL